MVCGTAVGAGINTGLFLKTRGIIVYPDFEMSRTTWNFCKKPVRQTFNEASYSTLGVLPENLKKAEFAKLGYESGRATFEIGFWLL